MTTDQLLLMLQAWKQAELDQMAVESAQSAGSHYLRDRLAVIAERCCRDWEGSLVEVGCLHGSTSIRLAEVARLHRRRLICIDPWTPNSQNISADAHEYNIFLETIKPFADVIDVLKLDSRDPQVAEYLKGRELCMAFIDGLHEYGAVINDIRMCYHAKLLACDDWTWSGETERGIVECTGTRDRIMQHPYHESYLL